MQVLALVEQWFLWFMIYSFIGWVYESILCSVLARKIVNRGFLNGPLCPIYGTGALMVVAVLGQLKGQPVLLFFASAILTLTLEYITSWLMEKLFHARWWDYSQQKFNINGRVSLIGFLGFGTMSVLVVEFVHPWVTQWTSPLSPLAMHILCACLLALFITDLVFTLIAVLGLEKQLKTMRENIAQVLKPPHILHRFQLRRLLSAFPRLDHTRYHDEWEALKERLRERFK